MPRVRPEGKEYFAAAARKSRNKRKLELKHLRERNQYLEQNENPSLKIKCEQLKQEIKRLSTERKQEIINESKIKVLTRESNEKNVLVNKIELYRECQDELHDFMKSLSKRITLKQEYFQVKNNLTKSSNVIEDVKTEVDDDQSSVVKKESLNSCKKPRVIVKSEDTDEEHE